MMVEVDRVDRFWMAICSREVWRNRGRFRRYDASKDYRTPDSVIQCKTQLVCREWSLRGYVLDRKGRERGRMERAQIESVCRLCVDGWVAVVNWIGKKWSSAYDWSCTCYDTIWIAGLCEVLCGLISPEGGEWVSAWCWQNNEGVILRIGCFDAFRKTERLVLKLKLDVKTRYRALRCITFKRRNAPYWGMISSVKRVLCIGTEVMVDL